MRTTKKLLPLVIVSVVSLCLPITILFLESHTNLFSHAAGITGNTYYVASSGVDTNDCSQANPCTVQAALVKSHPGDTVSITDGTYSPLVISATGSAESPITITTSYTNASSAGMLSRPPNPSDIVQQTPLLIIQDSSYLTVKGFTVLGMKTRSDANLSDKPSQGEVVVQNTSGQVNNGITLDHLYVANANGNCLHTTNQPITIKNSLFIQCGKDTTDAGIVTATSNITRDCSKNNYICPLTIYLNNYTIRTGS